MWIYTDQGAFNMDMAASVVLHKNCVNVIGERIPSGTSPFDNQIVQIRCASTDEANTVYEKLLGYVGAKKLP